jgi:hypothetical protein
MNVCLHLYLYIYINIYLVLPGQAWEGSIAEHVNRGGHVIGTTRHALPEQPVVHPEELVQQQRQLQPPLHTMHHQSFSIRYDSGMCIMLQTCVKVAPRGSSLSTREEF